MPDIVLSQPSTDRPHSQAKQSFFRTRPAFTAASGVAVGLLQIPKEKRPRAGLRLPINQRGLSRRTSRSGALGAAKGEAPGTRTPHT